MVPNSDGQLFDYAVQRLGVGDYGGPNEDRQYWRWRATQIHRLQLSRKKDPRASLDNLALVVDYCARRGIVPKAIGGLVYYLDDALRDVRHVARSEQPELEVQLAEAAALERDRALPDSDVWLEQLLGAKGDLRRDVLAEWQTVRAPLLW